MTVLAEQLKALFRGKVRGYPGEPAAMSAASLEQLARRVDVLQEQLGIILGRRGDVLDQHVAVRDLVDLGMLKLPGKTDI